MFKIMIVDDHKSFREVIKECLRDEWPSLLLEEAENVKDAMKKVEWFHPDLIFMDLRLPDGSGLALTKKIKADHPNTQVVVLTAYGTPEFENYAAECGAFRFLSKDRVTKKDFLVLLNSLVSS